MITRKGIFFRLIAGAFVIVALLSGTPFTKPVKYGRTGKRSIEGKIDLPNDTFWSPPRDSVGVSGFEKTLRSSRESMYITNNTLSDVAGAGITITYNDMDGRMLHKVSHDIDVDIPYGETRMVDIPSFDRQGLYYYYLSPLPVRANRATPFKVDVEVKYIIRHNHNKK